jgi:hypothetical protein
MLFMRASKQGDEETLASARERAADRHREKERKAMSEAIDEGQRQEVMTFDAAQIVQKMISMMNKITEEHIEETLDTDKPITREMKDQAITITHKSGRRWVVRVVEQSDERITGFTFAIETGWIL